MALIIDLIRHGEPLGGRKYRGNGTDDPLSDLGWAQMRAAVAERGGWDAIISSPMLRCCEFAEEVAEQRQLELSIVDNFKEIGMGAWEGLTRQDVMRQFPEGYMQYYRDPLHSRPLNGERLEALAERLQQAWETQFAQREGHVLLVAHAGVIRMLIALQLRAPLEAMQQIVIDYAGVSRIQIDEKGTRILFVNQAPALTGNLQH